MGDGKKDLKGRGRARWAGLFLFFSLAAGLAPRAFAADANQLYRDAVKLYEKGDYDKALKGFLKVMRQDPANAEAREYMLRCSQKIVETKLGGQAADTVEKEIDAEKEVQKLSPQTLPALSEDYVKPIKPSAATPAPVGEPAFSTPATSSGAATGEPSAASSIDQDIRNAASPTNARDLLAERSALTDDLRRRYLGKGNIVDVAESGGRLEVTFYLNRLFLPLSDTLRPDAYAVLDDIRALVQSKPKRTVAFTSVDNVSPAVRQTMADLSVRRTNVVFSYLLYASYALEADATDAPR